MNVRSSSPTSTSVGHVTAAEVGELIRLHGELHRERAPHHRRQRRPLAIAVLTEAGPLRDDALVRRRPQRVDLVEQAAQHGHAVLHGDAGAEAHEIRVDARWRARGRVHEHERVETVGVGEDHPARRHAAHRVTEQPERVELEPVGHRQHVGGQPVERVGRRIVRGVALAVPAQVERDDPMVTREGLHVVGEVLLGAAEAVYEDHRWGIVDGWGDGRGQRDPVIGGDDV